ncbi:MAG: alpha/beta hydrolase [Streptosporangiaceae bacterium]
MPGRSPTPPGGPSRWYMVTTEDRMIPPAAQRTMSQRTGATIVEVAASHSVYVSQPRATADLIKQAAQGAAAY